jgi:hypothetical protein
VFRKVTRVHLSKYQNAKVSTHFLSSSFSSLASTISRSLFTVKGETKPSVRALDQSP